MFAWLFLTKKKNINLWLILNFDFFLTVINKEYEYLIMDLTAMIIYMIVINACQLIKMSIQRLC